MTEALAAIGTAAVLCSVWAWSQSGWRITEGKTVVIHTKADSSVKGALVSRKKGVLVVKQASLLGPTSQTSIDGDVVILVDEVDWMQVL